MLYDYLAEFAAVVREGSLTKAAATLSVSQASLSRHMRALEAELGAKLFDRGLDGIHLTESGYGVYPLAAEIFDLGTSATAQCHEGGRATVLSVYGLDDYPAYMRILQEALPRWPGANAPATVHFLPHPSTRQELRAALAKNPCSLYFTLATDAELSQPSTSREVVELFHPQVVAVMDPSNPLASKDALTAADLQGQLVLRSDNNLRARIVCDDSQAILQRIGASCRFKSISWNSSTDFFRQPIKEGIFLLSAHTRGLAINSGYGMACVPLKGIRRTIVGVGTSGSPQICWLRSLAQTIEEPSPQGSAGAKA